MSKEPRYSYVHPSLRAVLERRIYHNRGPNKATEFVYEIPLEAGNILSMSPSNDQRYVLVDCERAVVRIEVATDKVEMMMLEPPFPNPPPSAKS